MLRPDSLPQRLPDGVPLIAAEGAERLDPVGEGLRLPALECERRLDPREERVERGVGRKRGPARGARLEDDLVRGDEVRRDDVGAAVDRRNLRPRNRAADGGDLSVLGARRERLELALVLRFRLRSRGPEEIDAGVDAPLADDAYALDQLVELLR